ncbi:MAG: RHS repeat domain-containing protein [Actinomycetota bacterium]
MSPRQIGSETVFYDDLGQLMQTTDVLGAVTQVSYDRSGRMAWSEDASRGASVSRLWLGTTASACGAAGVLADLPTPLGWHTLTYACFGASAFAALTIARTPDPGES